jgi:hypothetical protein
MRGLATLTTALQYRPLDGGRRQAARFGKGGCGCWKTAVDWKRIPTILGDLAMPPRDQKPKPRLAAITDNISIPIPANITPDQEAEFIAQYLRDHDITAIEREYMELTELVAQRERGELISAEQFLAELYGEDWDTKLA